MKQIGTRYKHRLYEKNIPTCTRLDAPNRI